MNHFYEEEKEILQNKIYENLKSQLDEEKLKCLNNKAFILNSLKRHKESIEIDELIFKENKNNHASLARTMHNYIKLGEFDKAKNISDQLKSLFPDQAEGDYNELFTLLKEVIAPEIHEDENKIKTDDVENQMQNQDIGVKPKQEMTRYKKIKRIMYLSFFLIILPVSVSVFAYYKNLKIFYSVFMSLKRILFLKKD